MDPRTQQTRHLLARNVPALLACEAALPSFDALLEEQRCAEAAEARGHFHPDEEQLILLRYTQYMAVRSTLVQMLAELRRHTGRTLLGWRRWPQRMPVFLAAYAAGCLLHRAASRVVGFAAPRPVVWRKLDEENRASGLPRKSFTHLYGRFSHPANLTRLLLARDFYRGHREAIREWADDPLVGPLVALLEREQSSMELRKSEALRRGAAYRWHSLLRRQRSAWKQVTFGLFKVGGCAVADLTVPGARKAGAAKRVDATIQQRLLSLLQPGDVLVTRHDDALSNLFLPGYWPHAALFIGDSTGWEAMPPGAAEGPFFLEAKKDGVRVRPAIETMAVDELLVMRPPLEAGVIEELIRKSCREHAGKPYDFVFDFRTADRLVCTEVVYRTYHGAGPVRFELAEVGGCLCLPAEAFLDQAMACGFELVAAAGLGGSGVLEGEQARHAFGRVKRPAAGPR